MASYLSVIFCFIVLTLWASIPASMSLAVMSIDLGSQFVKVAIVKPGVPMEIALNKESQRKTPAVVSMRSGERLIGDLALNVGVRFPSNAYWYLNDLIGKKFSNPLVRQFQKRFPYYDLAKDQETGLVLIQQDQDNVFMVEELLAMVLENAKETAESYAEQPIPQAVITVPPYYNQAERRAVLRAADIAGIKVLQLLNDNTAVALNYGVFRRKELNATVAYYMFFDMGASGTTASIIAYQEVKQKNAATGILDKFPQLTVKGVGFDRNLGGLEFQLRLRDHLAGLFNEQKKTPTDVRTNARAMAKLFKEAGRVKQVLSANADHYAQVEGLLDEKDFRAKITRTEYEDLCKDLFDRIGNVVTQALKSSDVTMAEISEVILMGGGTRVPKVQEMLKVAIGRQELGKGINTDEAAALGAVYQAAHLSKGFKVKKFGIKDANLYPIEVEFDRVKASTATDEGGQATRTFETKSVKRSLFGRNNAYPQKKVMTFNKNEKDFSFSINYGEMDFLSKVEQEIFGSTHLQQVTLVGIEDAHTTYGADSEPKGVKAHFRMDDSGLLTLDKAECIFEKVAPPTEAEESNETESTFSKIRGTISNFFGGGGEDAAKEGTVEEQAESKETEEETQVNMGDAKDDSKQETPIGDKGKEKDAEKKLEETEESQQEQKDESGEKVEGEKKEGQVPEAEKKGNQTAEQKDAQAKNDTKPRVTIIKANVTVDTLIVDVVEPSTKAIDAAKKRMATMREKDEARRKLEKAKNDLESFAVDTRERFFDDPAFTKCSTEKEREELQQKLVEAKDWLDEQDDTVETKVYVQKLTEVKAPFRPLFERVEELKERPRALEALNSIVNHSEYAVLAFANLTGDDMPFTEVEVTTLRKLIVETKEWNATMYKEQLATPLTDTPKMLVRDIALKIHDLDRELKYLVGKLRTAKPKPKPPKSEGTTPRNKTKSNETKLDPDDINLKVEDIKLDDYEQEEESEKAEEKGKGKGKKTKPTSKVGKEEVEEELGGERLELGGAEVEDDDKSTTESSRHDPDDEL